MGSSTIQLQDVVDSTKTMPALQPVLMMTGGNSNRPALTIANAVMQDLLSPRFAWKWNKIRLPAFSLNNGQRDYPMVNLTNLSWIENATVTDQNNTSFPKPTWPMEVVRDLPATNFAAGSPAIRICWFPNNTLDLGFWPGPLVLYTSPLGLPITPLNPPQSFLDSFGNILILTTYGTTGSVAPAAIAGAAAGTLVPDGTCVWTVCNPTGAGFRVAPVTVGNGNLYVVRAFGQASPPRFTTLAQTLDPIPDDLASTFEIGFQIYAGKWSPDDKTRAGWSAKRVEWLNEIEQTVKQADREPEAYGFTPDRSLMSSTGAGFSAGWPFPGRRRF